jgi:ubiquinone/menaquinone biosynthesis C-methylase UbiE
VLSQVHRDLKFKDKEFDIVAFNYVLHHSSNLEMTIAEAKRVAKIIVFCECRAWERQPLKAFSKAYWKLTDGGCNYLSLDEWKRRFALPVLDEMRGNGLVRYRMCVLQT